MSAHRTPEEVFLHHRQTLEEGDIWGIVQDYSDDALFIGPDGIVRGKDGVRQAFVKLLGDLPEARCDLKTLFADDVLFLAWSAESARTRVDDGVDTFVFADGLIRVQTVWYTLRRKPVAPHWEEGRE